MSVKINTLEIENVKRIKAVKMEVKENGLTKIGGKNGAGKTSVLDAVTWALKGDRYKPSTPKREDSVVEPFIKVNLSNGITVQRSGKKGALKVIDENGMRGGQSLLNAFICEFALNLPKFLEASSREKAKILLDIIGIGEQLQRLDKEEERVYQQRHAVGQIADQKTKYADELPYHADAPEQQVSIKDLILEQQQILMRNGANIDKIRKHDENKAALDRVKTEITTRQNELNALRQTEIKLNTVVAEGTKSVADLEEESTTEIEKSILNIEAINAHVRANLEKDKAQDEAEAQQREYSELTNEIEAIREGKTALLEGANLPFPELSVKDGNLIYKDKEWDCMAASDQLKVAVAIVSNLQPDCGFVLLDKLEQMDTDTLAEFGAWVNEQGLQVIATRVSTGDECSIILEDGTYVDPVTVPKFKVGEF